MRALVSGGGGFLGTRIVELLREEGHQVVVVSRHRYPHLEAMGARCVEADICDESAVQASMAGVDVVFHVAAKAGYWGSLAEYRRTNVEGTKVVLSAMRAKGVGKLVYTSTPSVVGYDNEVQNAKADLPYPARHESPYPETKAEAERLVLNANGLNLATVALRPHVIVGPGDQHVLPRMIRKAAEGKLMRVGDGTNRVDLTFVDNAAGAHLDAARALTGYQAPCAGRAYFISNGEPVVLWDYLNDLLRSVGIASIQRHLSLPLGRVLGRTMELAYGLVGSDREPPLTRYLASMLARSHWYDMEPAKQDLGYRIRVPMAEGTRRTVTWLKETRPWERRNGSA